jgi:hypothetical protein
MCYSAPVSFGTFVFISFVCIFLLQRNRGIDRAIAGILFVISLMQIIEGFLWLHPQCDNTNKLLASFIPLLLFAQPILITIIVILTNASWFPYIKLLPILFIISSPLLYNYLKNVSGRCVKPDCVSGHLDWSPVMNVDNTNTFPYLLYDIAMLIPLVTLRNPVFAGAYVASTIATRIFLEANYKRVWSSIWCHFVNILGVVAILV